MKKYFTIIALILLKVGFAMTPIDQYPHEALLLQGDNLAWKEVVRSVGEKEGKVYRIPVTEDPKKWTLVMAMHYNELPCGREQDYSVLNHFELLKKNVNRRYETVKWNIIDLSPHRLIYEWSQVLPQGKSFGESEIGSLILTDSTVHHIGITKRKNGLDKDERAKWIQRLSDNIAIMPFQEAGKIEGLSTYEKVKDSFSLSEFFKPWALNTHTENDNGFTFSSYVSPSSSSDYVSESLEVCTMPNLNGYSLDDLYQVEKQFKKQIAAVKDFKILEKGPAELIYTYSYSSGPMVLNGITRIVRTDYGYYSFTHKQFLKGLMQESEIHFWKDHLKAIQIK